jgi:hypothetical protein
VNTELYIENFRLDITKDISALLTFAIDDIKDFSARSTAWSKTIVIPGTANNNKQFGHIFQIGQANEFNDGAANVGYNFNASKSADCIIFQDQMQTFKGVLRLLQINIVEGRIEYEVSVFGKLSGLNVALSSGFLEQLDFSAYDHAFNGAAVSNSWENSSGAGFYYPMIDYGNYSTNKHDWDIRTFRPALFVREYIDKMITAAGYRWESDLFDSDRFKKLVIPVNKKELTVLQSPSFEALIQPEYRIIANGAPPDSADAEYSSFAGTGFSLDGTNKIITYNGSGTATFNLTVNLSGHYRSFFTTINIRVYHNSTIIASSTLPSAILVSTPWSKTFNIVGLLLSPTNTLRIEVSAQVDSATTYSVDIEGSFTATSDNSVYVPIAINDTVLLNDTIPKNVRQIDFLVGIVKLFNLYVYEDRFDTSLIYFKPYVDFYSVDTSNAIDWTYKLNRDKAIKIKPMSELTSKVYKFRFKEDNDYYNELYRKRYGQGYGDYIFDSQYEFSQQVKEFEILFSATPLIGYTGEDKIYPTIFKRSGPDTAPVEQNTDCNIRILQTKKVTGVSLWNMKDGLATVGFFTKYGYAGHLNDPDAPSDDINFGVLRELFFTLVTGNLSNTQFNLYWSSYMAEITDKDSKLLTGSFYLNPKDILELDFSKFIFVDGVLFRLNSIKDYNASKPTDCIVELLKVNYANYSDVGDDESPPPGNFLLWADGETLDWDTGEEIYYN